MAVINGTSPNFKIKLIYPDGAVKEHTFSFRYKEMRFYSEEFYKTPQGGRARSGKILKKFKWIINYYEIDWSEKIEDADAYKVQEVLNAEAQGAKIILTPVLSVPGRYEEVSQLIDDNGSAGKKELSPRIRAAHCKGSKGLVITYTSANPMQSLNWVNPDTIDSRSFIVGDVVR